LQHSLRRASTFSGARGRGAVEWEFTYKDTEGIWQNDGQQNHFLDAVARGNAIREYGASSCMAQISAAKQRQFRRR
jgi:hypothetical protein